MIQTGLRKQVERTERRQGGLEPPACSGIGRQIFTRTSLPYHHASNNLAHAPSVLALRPNREKVPQVLGLGVVSGCLGPLWRHHHCKPPLC